MADGFFSKAAGQDRRKWLDSKANGAMGYVPPEMRKWLEIADMMSPVSDIGRAGQAADRMMDPNLSGWDRAAAGGDMLVDMASVLAPAGAAKMAGAAPTKALMEGLFGWAPDAEDALGRFAADESGALRLFPRGDYAGSHTAPVLEDGATLHNPTAMFGGDDIYTSKARQYFGTGMDEADSESLAAISRAKGRPNGAAWVYRAVPKDAPNEIGVGDWVSTSKSYAKDHGESSLGGRGKYKIVSEKVGTSELATDGNSINEWGWWPSEGRIRRALEGRLKKADRAAIEEYAKSIGMDLSPPTKAPPTKAQQIADMLANGRAGDVTDDLMAQADPSELWKLYEAGATGADMPMDAASRMQRAEGMGFDTGTPLYHGSVRDFDRFIPSQSGKIGPGVYMTPSERKAGIFSGYEYGHSAGIEKMLNEGNEKASEVYGLVATNRPATMEARQAARTNASAYDDRIEAYRAKFDEMGFDGVSVEDERTILNPANIRSKFARFDPRLKHLANLSAGGAGVAYMGNEDDQKAQIRAWLEGQR